MKFSFLLCTLDRKELAINAIKSILNQTYDDYEIIVVDQSSDNSKDEYERIDHRINADITTEIDRRPVRVGLSATRSEQIGEGRTVGACRRMEVFDNSASMSGLLLRVCKMQIQFREAELPVDLRPRKLEVVF